MHIILYTYMTHKHVHFHRAFTHACICTYNSEHTEIGIFIDSCVHAPTGIHIEREREGFETLRVGMMPGGFDQPPCPGQRERESERELCAEVLYCVDVPCSSTLQNSLSCSLNTFLLSPEASYALQLVMPCDSPCLLVACAEKPETHAV